MFGAELAPPAVMEVAPRWPHVEQPPGTRVRENETLVPAGAEVVEEVQLDDLRLAKPTGQRQMGSSNMATGGAATWKWVGTK